MEQFNPFLIYGYKGPEYFCDRKEETAKLESALKNGRNVVLMSPRRMGKTGLIMNTFHLIKEKNPDIYTFYFDIMGTSSMQDFVKIFAQTVLGKLDTNPQKALKRVRDFIYSCRPIFSYDPVSGAPEVKVDAVSSNAEVTLKEIFEYLASTEKRCYIAIDEFQQIAKYPDKNAEAILRSYIQFIPNANFIFAGSKLHLLSEMFVSAKRPFYQSAQNMPLFAIDKDEYYKFASDKFKTIGINLQKEDFLYIYKRYEGHTWYVQDVLNRLYNFGTEINDTVIDKAVDDILDEFSYNYEQVLQNYPAPYVNIIKAIAQKHVVQQVTSADFLNEARIKSPSSMQRAIKNLINDEIVYKDSKGYSIYDRFLEEWLNRAR